MSRNYKHSLLNYFFLLVFIFLLSTFSVYGKEITLKSGWKLIGSCSKIITEQTFNKPEIKTVWGWNNGSWQVYSPDKNIAALLINYKVPVLDTLYPFQGFWVFSSSQEILSFPEDNSSANMVFLEKGWNLKGASYSVDIKNSFNKDYIQSVWRWTGATWQIYTNNQVILELFKTYQISSFDYTEEFEGFWILSAQNQATIFKEKGDIISTYIVSKYTPYQISKIKLNDTGRDVYISGNYAYVANEVSGLTIIDISDVYNPFIVSSLKCKGKVVDVSVYSNLAFLAEEGDGIEIVNVSNINNPVIISSIDIKGWVYGVYAKGDYVYVAAGNGGINIINIKDPYNPKIEGMVKLPSTAFSIFVSGKYAYVADWIKGLQIIDVSKPASPKIISSYVDEQNKCYISDVYVEGNYAFIGGSCGLLVVNIKNPLKPFLEGKFVNKGKASKIFVKDNLAFITDDYYCKFKVLEISNLSKIEEIAFTKVYSPKGIFLKDNYAIIPTSSNSLKIFIAKDKKPPVINTSSHLKLNENKFLVSYLNITESSLPLSFKITGGDDADKFNIDNKTGALLFKEMPDYENPEDKNHDNIYEVKIRVTDPIGNFSEKLFKVDIQDNSSEIIPASPYIIGEVNIKDTYKIFLKENYIFAASHSKGLRIFDISNPYLPKLISEVKTKDEAVNVFVKDNKAYVSEGKTGVEIFDITDLKNIVSVNVIDTPGTALGVKLLNNYLLIADGYKGVRIVDVSNPLNPSFVSSFETDGYAKDIIVRGNYLFIGNSSQIDILDLSDIYNLKEISTLYLPGWGVTSLKDITEEPFLFVVNGSGLHSIDIKDINSPKILNSFYPYGYNSSFSINGEFAYVTAYNVDDKKSKIILVDIKNPSNMTEVSNIDLPGKVTDVVNNKEYLYIADNDSLIIIDIFDHTPPLILNPEEYEIKENFPLNLKLQIKDGSYPLYFKISGNDADKFYIDNKTGILHLYNTLNYEEPSDYNHDNIYEIKVTVIDSNGNSTEKYFKFKIKDIEEIPPKIITPSTIFSEENKAAVSYIKVQDESLPVVFSIIGGDDADKFFIDNYTGELRFKLPPDYEKPEDCNKDNIYEVKIKITDNESNKTEQTFNIIVQDVNPEYTPSYPFIAGLVDIEGYTKSLFISENYVFISDNINNGPYYFKVYDIRDITSPSLVGSIKLDGWIGKIFVYDKFAYTVSFPNRFYVIDISDPSNMKVVDNITTIEDPYHFTIDNNRFAYISNNTNLQIIDASIAGNAHEVANISIDALNNRIYKSGKYLYHDVMEGNTHFLNIYDMKTPFSLQIIGKFKISNWVKSIKVEGAYAYIAVADKTIQVIDISNPTNPILISSFKLDSYIQDLYVKGRYIYATGTELLYIIDATDPFHPVFIKNVPIVHQIQDGWGRNLFVSNNFAFIADGKRGLQIVKLYDDTPPVILNDDTVKIENLEKDPIKIFAIDASRKISYSISGGEDSSLFNIDNLTGELYFKSNVDKDANYDNVFEVKVRATDPNGNFSEKLFKISTLNLNREVIPDEPEIVSTVDVKGSALTVVGNYAFVGSYDRFTVINISNPLNPALRGHINVKSCNDIKFYEKYIYTLGGGLHIIDINNEYNPKIVSSSGFNGNNITFGKNNRIYLAGSYSGFFILDHTDIKNIKKIVSFKPIYETEEIRLFNDYILVGDVDGIQIYKINSLDNISLVKSDSSPRLENFIIDESLLFGIDAWVYSGNQSNFYVVNISNPENPQKVVILPLKHGFLRSILKQDNYIYIATEQGLSIIDVSSPQSPVEKYFITILGGIDDIYVKDNYVYAIGDKFYVIKLSNLKYLLPPSVNTTANPTSEPVNISDENFDNTTGSTMLSNGFTEITSSNCAYTYSNGGLIACIPIDNKSKNSITVNDTDENVTMTQVIEESEKNNTSPFIVIKLAKPVKKPICNANKEICLLFDLKGNYPDMTVSVVPYKSLIALPNQGRDILKTGYVPILNYSADVGVFNYNDVRYGIDEINNILSKENVKIEVVMVFPFKENLKDIFKYENYKIFKVTIKDGKPIVIPVDGDVHVVQYNKDNSTVKTAIKTILDGFYPFIIAREMSPELKKIKTGHINGLPNASITLLACNSDSTLENLKGCKAVGYTVTDFNGNYKLIYEREKDKKFFAEVSSSYILGKTKTVLLENLDNTIFERNPEYPLLDNLTELDKKFFKKIFSETVLHESMGPILPLLTPEKIFESYIFVDNSSIRNILSNAVKNFINNQSVNGVSGEFGNESEYSYTVLNDNKTLLIEYSYTIDYIDGHENVIEKFKITKISNNYFKLEIRNNSSNISDLFNSSQEFFVFWELQNDNGTRKIFNVKGSDIDKTSSNFSSNNEIEEDSSFYLIGTGLTYYYVEKGESKSIFDDYSYSASFSISKRYVYSNDSKMFIPDENSYKGKFYNIKLVSEDDKINISPETNLIFYKDKNGNFFINGGIASLPVYISSNLDNYLLTYEKGNIKTIEYIAEEVLSFPTGSLSGSVKDILDDSPIPNVRVTLSLIEGNSLNNYSLYSDSSGNYYFTNIPKGTYSITFEKYGYISNYGIAVIEENYNNVFPQVKILKQEFGGNGKIFGIIKNSITGDGVSGVKIDVFKGINNNFDDNFVCSSESSDYGEYSLNLEAGLYSVFLSKENFLKDSYNILVIGNQETKKDLTISPSNLTDEIRIVLTWGESPKDLDSHLVKLKDNETIFHLYFDNMKPSEEAFLDTDDTDSFGPETITIKYIDSNATYRYYVHDYSTNSGANSYILANSGATVKVYWKDKISTFYVPNYPGTVWKVFEIKDNKIILCTGEKCVFNVTNEKDPQIGTSSVSKKYFSIEKLGPTYAPNY